MKQVIQSLKTGETQLVDVPCPAAQAGHLLIRTTTSLISAGTERMMLDFGKANLLQKARQQPDKVRMVLDKVRTDGLLPTIETVRNKLDQEIATGYCNVGTIIEAGPDTLGFERSDRVVSNGHHAEVVCVPRNLCAKIPDTVTDEAAAFTVLGAIALQGVRLAQPTLGETFAVSGLGLVGLLTVQILRAHGCNVLGIDFDSSRLALARQFGAETVDLSKGEDPVAAANELTKGRGIDGVLIAAATKSDEPVHQAATMCRKRGRIILIGVTGLQLSRADFYEKELTFQVSCSYGPGRYDPTYEGDGRDYPLPFVRWTEQRNFEAVLDLLKDGRIDVAPLISHQFRLVEAQQAYDAVTSATSSLGVILNYYDEKSAQSDVLSRTVPVVPQQRSNGRLKPHAHAVSTRTLSHPPRIGFVGAGNFARGVLIPAFQRAGAQLEIIASERGLSGVTAARKFGFKSATSDSASVIENADVDAVVIATRHDTHADLVCRALQAGKHVFVEKPLALNEEQLQQIILSHHEASETESMPLLMVGFNRRFAPTVQKMVDRLRQSHTPKSFVMTVNAGAIPAEHWIQDPMLGGGRIIGEGCHFIDLLRYLAGQPIEAVQATLLGDASNKTAPVENVSFTLQFADGSIGTIHYLANGHRGFPKERLEVFCDGQILQIDNFRTLRGWGWPGLRKMASWRQDKGHSAEVKAFLAAIGDGKESPILFSEAVEVTRASFAVQRAAELGESINLSSGEIGITKTQSNISQDSIEHLKRSA